MSTELATRPRTVSATFEVERDGVTFMVSFRYGIGRHERTTIARDDRRGSLVLPIAPLSPDRWTAKAAEAYVEQLKERVW